MKLNLAELLDHLDILERSHRVRHSICKGCRMTYKPPLDGSNILETDIHPCKHTNSHNDWDWSPYVVQYGLAVSSIAN
jgi:hypothetical protein